MKRLTSSGETIVEVLIVTVILTSVMATMFGITTHTLSQDRASQERTEAASYAQEQIERLVAATSNGVITDPTLLPTYFCLIDVDDPSMDPVKLVPAAPSPPTSVPIQCQSNRYNGYFSYDTTNRVYVETVFWDNATGQGQDTLTLNYRTQYALAGGPVVVPPPVVPPPPPALCVPASIPPTGSIEACYYNDNNNGSYFTTLASSTTQNPVGSGPNPNATNIIFNDWGLGSPTSQSDDFSARFQGKFNFVAGNYTFFAGGDDGIRFYIDGALKINAWVDQSYTQYAVTVPMTAGLHTVKMEFYERGGFAKATLSWVPPAATVIEGESFPSPGAWIAPIAEGGASGGAVMRFLSAGVVSKTQNVPAFNSIAVRARGDQYHGSPKMTVKVDGVTMIAGLDVPNPGYQTFAAPTGAIAAGSHIFEVSFDNDACGDPPDICGPAYDRNLYFDTLSLIQN